MKMPILHWANSEILPLGETKDQTEYLHNVFRISVLFLWSVVAWLGARLFFKSLLEVGGRAETTFDGDFGI